MTLYDNHERSLIGDKWYAYGDTLNNFTLRYIINLPCLDYESDSLLASSLHIDIVNKAVDICMKAHQNNLYLKQVAMQQNNERE